MEKQKDRHVLIMGPVSPVVPVILIVFTLGFHVFAAAGGFPREMAGLKLLAHVEGEEARKLVYGLHGKDLRLHQAFVLRYGAPEVTSHTATVWISRSRKEKQARTLMERMTGMIKGGAGPYGHFKEFTVNDTRVISLFGKKRRHYIYLRDRDVIWIEVDYPVAGQFLEQALEKLR